MLLRAWRGGDAEALSALAPLVYRELRKIANSHMRRENQGRTLTPTALVNETFLKLMQSGAAPDWQDRKHFFVVAASAMRRLLVDHARGKRADKRSGGVAIEGLPPSLLAAAPAYDLVDLDRVLAKLAVEEPTGRRCWSCDTSAV